MDQTLAVRETGPSLRFHPQNIPLTAFSTRDGRTACFMPSIGGSFRMPDLVAAGFEATGEGQTREQE